MCLDNCTFFDNVSVSNILTMPQSRLNLILNVLARLMSCCLCPMSQAFESCLKLVVSVSSCLSLILNVLPHLVYFLIPVLANVRLGKIS